jgi:hypothetical protein
MKYNDHAKHTKILQGIEICKNNRKHVFFEEPLLVHHHVQSSCSDVTVIYTVSWILYPIGVDLSCATPNSVCDSYWAYEGVSRGESQLHCVKWFFVGVQNCDLSILKHLKPTKNRFNSWDSVKMVAFNLTWCWDIVKLGQFLMMLGRLGRDPQCTDHVHPHQGIPSGYKQWQ